MPDLIKYRVQDAGLNALIYAMVGQNAPGAYPVGTVIFKTRSQENDYNNDGARGIVNGSIKYGPLAYNGEMVTYCYVIVWDNYPNAYAFTADVRVTNIPPDGYVALDPYEF